MTNAIFLSSSFSPSLPFFQDRGLGNGPSYMEQMLHLEGYLLQKTAKLKELIFESCINNSLQPSAYFVTHCAECSSFTLIFFCRMPCIFTPPVFYLICFQNLEYVSYPWPCLFQVGYCILIYPSCKKKKKNTGVECTTLSSSK